MPGYTNTDFLTSVRNQGNLPNTTNNNNVNSTVNLLRVATAELHIRLMPLIMSVRDEFYVRTKDYAITSNQRTYLIPERASGMVLRDVQIVQGTDIRSLEPIQSEHITTTSTGTPEGYYFEHDSVVLYPTPSSTSGTLRMRYFTRPSTLVATAECAQIASINTTLKTVTVTTIPGSWVATTSLDFVRQNSPHTCLEIDQAAVSVVTTTIEFAALPSGLVVGDWLALAGETPIPQIPTDFRPVLAQMTVAQVLMANGDKEGAAAADRDVEKLSAYVLALITPRNQGANKKIIPRRWR